MSIIGYCPGSAVVGDGLIYDFRPVSSDLGMWSVSDIWAIVPVAQLVSDRLYI